MITSNTHTWQRRERVLERKSGLSPGWWWVGLLVVMIVTGYPLLQLLLKILQFDGRLSLESLHVAFTGKKYLTSFLNTLYVGLLTTTFSLLIGVPLALVVGRIRIPGGKLLRVILMIPYLIPGFVFAFAWRELLGPVGYLNKFYMLISGASEPLFSIYGPVGVVQILVLRGYPIVFITVIRSLRNMNAGYEEAAEVFGAGSLQTMRTITLPLMLPSISGAAILVFSSSIANFGVPAILGSPEGFYVLTTQIYSTILSYGLDNNLNIAASLSLYLIAAGLLFLGLQSRIISRRSYVVVTGKGGRTDLAPPGPEGWVYTLVLSLMGFALVILPLVAIGLSSITRAYGLMPRFENFTLKHFTSLLTDTFTTTALRNSFFLAFLSATLCTIIGFLIAVVTERSKILGRKILDFVATTPRSIPGTIIALAFILAWIRPIPLLGISLYNTFWIILLAYLSRFLGYTVRTISATLKQISPSLEEACLISGGKNWQRIAHILTPLSVEGLAGGWLLVFIPSLNELTMSILLYSSGKETIGVAVFSLLQEGKIGRAAAFSIVIIVIVLLGDRLLHRVTKGKRSLLG
ncbi:MAG: iron ABC transporter permease [Spirochaetaceae bacterium]|nr:iron ABC transporter permease [Spirochaetaceae bacterium]